MKLINYISCGLAHEMVGYFYNVCVTEKEAKHLPYMRTISKMAKPLLNKYDVTSHMFPNTDQSIMSVRVGSKNPL